MAEHFEEKFRKIHGNKYGYEEFVYINCETKSTIICPIHGPFQQSANKHLCGRGCPPCGRGRANVGRKKTTKQYLEEIVEVHGNRYDYSKTIYTTALEKIIIICLIEGHGEFTQTASSHLGGAGCPVCANNITKTLSQFIKESIGVHGNIYGYEEYVYVNAHTPGKILCKVDDHGYFHKDASHHIRRKQGCPRCILTKGYSDSAILWLEGLSHMYGLNIHHKENGGEVKVKSDKSGYFSFDGYCKENNTVYEYYGCFYHGCNGCDRFCNPEEMNKLLNITYGELYENTIKREDYIKSLGYNLVTIWEHEFTKIYRKFTLKNEETNKTYISLFPKKMKKRKNKKYINVMWKKLS